MLRKRTSFERNNQTVTPGKMFSVRWLFFQEQMTDLEIKAIKLLAKCTFVPATNTKSFVRNMEGLANGKPEQELSEGQKKYLWQCVWRFRRQHRNKWFIHYAHKKAKIEKPINPKDYL